MGEKGVPTARLQFAFIIAAMALLVALVLELYATRGLDTIALRDVGSPSIPSLFIQTTILVSLMATTVSLRRFNPEREEIQHGAHSVNLFRWISRAGVVLAIVFALTLLLIVAFLELSRAVPDFTLSAGAMFIVLVIYAPLLGFVLAYWTSALDYQQVFWFTSTFLVLGLIGAVILAPDNGWWTGVLSFLGTSSSGWVFNFTFILSGLLLLTVISDVLDDLNVLRTEGDFQSPHFRAYRIVLALQCVAIAGIGLFPYIGITFQLHRLVAGFAVLTFLFFGPAFMYLVPVYTPTERRLSTLPMILAVLVGLLYLYFTAQTSYKLFTLAELICIGLIIVWVVIFYLASRAYILKIKPDLGRD